LRVWDTTNGDELLALPGHEDWIWTAAWSPDGERFVSASEDGSAKVWDGESGDLLLTFGEHSPVSASWAPDGDRIVTASLDGSAKIWDAETGEVLNDLFPEDFTSGVSTAAWSPDGTRIATFSQDSVGRIWDADSGEQILTSNTVSGEPKAFWSPSGDHIVTGGLNGVQVWDANTGNQLLSLSDSFAYSKWSPDGTRIALGDNVGPLEVFPIWRSLEELVDLAKDCCVIGALTAEERAEFGLPAQ
jgi:WD40 repeat protein